jgi:hypothetical protein
VNTVINLYVPKDTEDFLKILVGMKSLNYGSHYCAHSWRLGYGYKVPA